MGLRELCSYFQVKMVRGARTYIRFDRNTSHREVGVSRNCVTFGFFEQGFEHRRGCSKEFFILRNLSLEGCCLHVEYQICLAVRR